MASGAGKDKHLGDVLGVGDCLVPDPSDPDSASSMPLAIIVDDRAEVNGKSCCPADVHCLLLALLNHPVISGSLTLPLFNKMMPSSSRRFQLVVA